MQLPRLLFLPLRMYRYSQEHAFSISCDKSTERALTETEIWCTRPRQLAKGKPKTSMATAGTGPFTKAPTDVKLIGDWTRGAATKVWQHRECCACAISKRMGKAQGRCKPYCGTPKRAVSWNIPAQQRSGRWLLEHGYSTSIPQPCHGTTLSSPAWKQTV